MRRQRMFHGAVVLCLLAAASCGPDAKKKALRATLTGVNAARDGFVAWDYTHQQGIVDDATSLEDGKAKLKDYRTKREKVVISFEIAYRSLAVAALDLTAANVGEALRIAGDLYDSVRQLMGKDTPAGVPASDKPAETPPVEAPPTEPPVEVPAPAPTPPVTPAPAAPATTTPANP